MKIFIVSRTEFIRIMNINELNDSNVESKDNSFFISISGSGKDSTFEPHYFKENHNNVLNLNFDDIITEIDGYKCFDEQLAKETYNFIKQNLNKKGAIIHCSAGISRSGAVGRFINDIFGSEDFTILNPHIHPNPIIYRLLVNEYEKDDTLTKN